MTQLNSLSHYSYQQCGGGYSFCTESGNTYLISFVEYNLIPEAKNTRLYMFNIERVDEQNHDNGTEDKVRNTILCILQSFFENYTDAIVTVCDMTDGLQEARYRLFSQWAKQFMPLEIKSVEASFCIDKVRTFATLYYHACNIDAAVLVKGFEDLADINFYS